MIEPARLEWRNGNPYSITYGDIYHASDGIAEVERVFLEPAGFQALLGNNRPLQVGELGFGTGLNFAVLAEHCINSRTSLHFVSVDSAPLHPDDFSRIAQDRQSRLPLYRELAGQYPPLLPGWQQRTLADGLITLSLYWGEASRATADLATQQRLPFDLWLLDGFAPDRNPQLWTEALFANIATVSRPGTRLSTFTAAGRVRRALTAAGFHMRRVDQRPHKRESLAGVLDSPGPGASAAALPAGARTTLASQGPEAATRTRDTPEHVHVVGAGIAGASQARHLADAGIHVTVLDSQAPASGASAIPATVLHGRLLADATPNALLRAKAANYAATYCARFAGEPTGVHNSGALQLASANYPATRLEQVAQRYGASGPWLELLDSAGASLRAGLPISEPALWFANACTIDTPALCRTLLDHPRIEVRTGEHVASWPEGATVLACGTGCQSFPGARYLELAPVAGQVEVIRATGAPLTQLRVPVVGRGYLAPLGSSIIVGATYEYRAWAHEDATATNLEHLTRFGAQSYRWTARVRGTRSVSSDRAAVAGPLYDPTGAPVPERYVTTGHGSMGTVTSHLAAAIVTAHITGRLPPVDAELLELVSPLRFRLRQSRRGFRFGARE